MDYYEAIKIFFSNLFNPRIRLYNIVYKKNVLNNIHYELC